MIQARATSFATFKDLVAYIDCRNQGGSETHCYNYGDNGRGCFGDVTAQVQTPMVAIPESEMITKWGAKKYARGKKVAVTLQLSDRRITFNAECRDQAPDGVIDLNPASLAAANLPIDTELNCPAEWDWLEI